MTDPEKQETELKPCPFCENELRYHGGLVGHSNAPLVVKCIPSEATKARLKKYKYITIRQVGEEVFEGKPVYRIFNTRSNGQIGLISWYKPWKEYVFSSIPDCVFNNSCLRDVLDFIVKELEEKK